MSVYRRRGKWVVQVYDPRLKRQAQVGTFGTRQEARIVEAEHYGRPPETRRIKLADHELGHSVYRCFDQDDVLLYVGITNRGRKRINDHGSDRDWWRLCASIRVEHFATREEALDAEAEAIRIEPPRHNILLNRSAVTADDPAPPPSERACALIDPAPPTNWRDLA